MRDGYNFEPGWTDMLMMVAEMGHSRKASLCLLHGGIEMADLVLNVQS